LLLRITDLRNDFGSSAFGSFLLGDGEIGALKAGLATVLARLTSCASYLAPMTGVARLFDGRGKGSHVGAVRHASA
jgi:hypothetical protein